MASRGLLSVLAVSGRVRIVAGSNRIGVSDAPVGPMDDDLSASEVPSDVLRAALRRRLIVEVGARPVGIWLLDVPTTVRVRDDVLLVASWHRTLLSRS